MNEYKLLVISNGMPQTIFLVSNDVTQAAYASGVNIMEIVKIELVDSQNVLDFRIPE